jgi:hypothetical protein
MINYHEGIVDGKVVVGINLIDEFLREKLTETTHQVTYRGEPIFDKDGNPLSRRETEPVMVLSWGGEEILFKDVEAATTFLHEKTGLECYTPATDQDWLFDERCELILGELVIDLLEGYSNEVPFGELTEYKRKVSKALPVEQFPAPDIKVWTII